MRSLSFLVLTIVLLSPVKADDNLKTVVSAFSVQETLDRLAKILESKGISVLARIDHAAGAKKAGLALDETQLLIFGNPKLGTPLMQSQRTIGLDLPMKALAWKGADGKVRLSYTLPKALKSRHGVADQDAIFSKMTKALAALTSAATKQK
ncbi:MAG: DUF302 domain-containing protein [Hyphomicrobiaceae bacterium]